MIRQEKLAALFGLSGVAVVAWIYLLSGAARMAPMPSGMAGSMQAAMAMPVVSPWTAAWLVPTFLMWAVMMVGMMLPSAAPAVVLYGSLVRRNRERGSALPSVWIFTGGYLAVWTAFSLAATLLQAALQHGALVSPMMVSTSPWLSGGLLILAGTYQWLPWKDACLEKCRTPLQHFLFRWRPGVAGAFRMGAEHGTTCVGCCWALMLVLFAVGVMNLLAVALITGYLFVEKLLPGGRLAGRVAGGAMIVTGLAMVFTGVGLAG